MFLALANGQIGADAGVPIELCLRSEGGRVREEAPAGVGEQGYC